ncbi:MAG: hypothetical protein ACI87N_001403 [Flavobacteriales bacterium]|jgi:hypothetical protein
MIKKLPSIVVNYYNDLSNLQNSFVPTNAIFLASKDMVISKDEQIIEMTKIIRKTKDVKFNMNFNDTFFFKKFC